MDRQVFVFSDWLQAGGCLGTGYGEGSIPEASAAYLAVALPTRLFAGIVCVADCAGPDVSW